MWHIDTTVIRLLDGTRAYLLARLIDQLRVQTLTPDGQKAVARFTDIVIHDGSLSAVAAPAGAGDSGSRGRLSWARAS